MARPIHGPTPLAMPTAGSTNGNTMYISRQRTVATSNEVWNAFVPVGAVPLRAVDRQPQQRAHESIEIESGPAARAAADRRPCSR